MKKNTIIKVVSIVLSVLLSVALCFSLVALVVASVTRDYLTSNEVDEVFNNMDLATLKFEYNGEIVTIEKYVKEYATTKIENSIKDNPLSEYTDFLYPFADSITDFVVDKALSSEYVNRLAKQEIKSVFEYLLYSDVEEAKQRIKDDISLEENYKLNPDNATNYEDKISAEVKLAVFKYVEEESGMSTDEIIVFLSEDTISKLKIACVVLFILLFAVSIPEFPLVVICASFILFGFKAAVCSLTNDFKEIYVGKEDLISHQFLKSLADNFTLYADRAGSIAIVCLVIFVALFIVIHFTTKKKENKPAKSA